MNHLQIHCFCDRRLLQNIFLQLCYNVINIIDFLRLKILRPRKKITAINSEMRKLEDTKISHLHPQRSPAMWCCWILWKCHYPLQTLNSSTQNNQKQRRQRTFRAAATLCLLLVRRAGEELGRSWGAEEEEEEKNRLFILSHTQV